jgi:hypothetical protein
VSSLLASSSSSSEDDAFVKRRVVRDSALYIERRSEREASSPS